MKSSIKIDFTDRGDGKGLQPVIKIRKVHTSDDTRDKLLDSFFQKLFTGHTRTSRYLLVEFDDLFDTDRPGGDSGENLSIYPLSLADLPKTIKEMQSIWDNNTYPAPEDEYKPLSSFTVVSSPDVIIDGNLKVKGKIITDEIISSEK